jgi:hemerythrin-like metal-binding protein
VAVICETRKRNRLGVDPLHLNGLEAVDIDRSKGGLQWSKAYDCGNPVIDSEHRDLISLANALFGSNFEPEVQPRKLRLALDRLLGHVKMHFANEEAQLGKQNYRGLRSHKAAHARLLSNAEELNIPVQSGKRTLGAYANSSSTKLSLSTC